MTKELKEEILNLLNDAYYWKESTSEHKKRINAVYEQLTIPVVVSTSNCEHVRGGLIERNKEWFVECRKCCELY